MSQEALDKIKEKFGESVIETHSQGGDDTALVVAGKWLECANFARNELKMDMFIDLTAVDYLGREEGKARFEVVLHLRSNSANQRIRLKARVSEGNPVIDSLCGVWKGANWFERECFEMYGIKFNGHPNLKQLLLYPEFKGNPLRKDYPIDKRQPRIKLLSPETRRSGGREMDETKHGHEDGEK